jgi:hypothetical protein
VRYGKKERGELALNTFVRRSDVTLSPLIATRSFPRLSRTLPMWGVTLAKESSEGEKDWNNGSREHRRECMRTLEAGDVDGETDRGSSSFQTTRYRRREYDRLRTERLTRVRDDHSIVSLATETISSFSSFCVPSESFSSSTTILVHPSTRLKALQP